MKILILGAKGMLGQAVAEVFQEGHELFLWDRNEIDITDRQSAVQKILALGPELLINTAAYTNVDGAESQFLLANSVNGDAVGYIAQACKTLDVPMVHYSTEYVFDGEKPEGYDEQDTPNPISAYGRSKFLGEQELRKNADKFYLIRLSRLFGKAGGGKISFVNKILDEGQKQIAAGAKDPIPVVDEELSCPTYAPDLAKLARQIVESGLPFGIYHGANSGSVTWYQFAQEIFKISRIDVKLKAVPGSFFPRPARRPRFAVLRNTKLAPQRPWQEALREFYFLNPKL